MRIYVVQGRTGEYGDKCEWNVKAFRTREQAMEFANNANKRAEEIFKSSESKYGPYKGINEFDPFMVIDYTGTGYYYFELELVE